MWEVCGYKSTEDLSKEEETASVAVINYSQEQLGTMIEKIAGDDSRMAWIEPIGLVLDAFRGHFDKKVEAHNANHPLLKWLMMDDGITPKAQPLDILINKFFKGFFCDLFK